MRASALALSLAFSLSFSFSRLSWPPSCFFGCPKDLDFPLFFLSPLSFSPYLGVISRIHVRVSTPPLTDSVLSFLQEVDQKTGGGEMKPAKIEIYEMYFT